MAEAWQIRELEQQKLLEKIMEDAYCIPNAGDGDYDTFFLMLSADLAEILAAARIDNKRRSIFANTSLKYGGRLILEYSQEFIAKIEEFERTPEEGKQLLARLFIKFAETGLSEIRADYLRQSVHEPQRLYNGHNAMDEVLFPDDEDEG